MRRVPLIIIGACASTFLVPPGAGPALAGKEGVGLGPVFVPPAISSGGSAAVSAEAARVAEEINLAQDFCSRLRQKEYVIDCLAAEFGAVAASMSDDGALAPAKAALTDASQKLAGIARKNRSSTLPAAVARSETRRSTRPLVPVESASLPDAASEAIAVVETTGTILLRSSETSAEAAGFVAISTAVSSGTILLRSI